MAVTTNTAAELNLTNAFARFLVWLGDMSAGAQAAQHAAALTQLSDEQLAKQGVKREKIVEHAFKHLING